MPLLKLLFLALLLAVGTCAFSQMMPMTNTINTPRGPVQYTTWRPMPMMYYGGTVSPSVKYPFTIVFSSDSSVQVKAKINVSEKNHFIKTKINKQKVVIKPRDTKEIYRIDETGLKIAGMPTDSCWLFLAVKGKINGYSYLAEKGSSSLIAIQKGEGAPILPLNKINLEEMVAENPEALKFAQKKKLEKAITTFNK
jgi:hypothetical protein